jgi:hypothetical protein
MLSISLRGNTSTDERQLLLYIAGEQRVYVTSISLLLTICNKERQANRDPRTASTHNAANSPLNDLY